MTSDRRCKRTRLCCRVAPKRRSLPSAQNHVEKLDTIGIIQVKGCRPLGQRTPADAGRNRSTERHQKCAASGWMRRICDFTENDQGRNTGTDKMSGIHQNRSILRPVRP
ncbi:hypothetical protein RHECNPAF_446005 [Rhizobium etli CNPAF512]|nr:hypothetical protein RHECNPAF_446005 [Rhizobium etli CNPAF512]